MKNVKNIVLSLVLVSYRTIVHSRKLTKILRAPQHYRTSTKRHRHRINQSSI
jgi:hypothetical protein